ncbi:cytochrome P450 [Obba rivulosa]|uniref:Cytochrome P450 n=1 Tax=Obba rivulosa TaxID=1052685 RepID=A0A8E2DMB8_9APHY|nr:cytochrome P450 [Obba rivulosa]
MLKLGEQLGIVLLTLMACYILVRYMLISGAKVLPYPPRPPTIPVIGNIMDIRTPSAWLKLTKYKKTYGLGRSVFVLNFLKAMNDLLEKCASKYSDRPVLTFANDLVGLNRVDSEEWHAQCKLAHAALGPATVIDYIIMQEDIMAGLAKDLLKTPKNFYSLIHVAAGKIVITITYGTQPSTTEDEFIFIAEKVNRIGTQAAMPGTYLCDILPILAYGRQAVHDMLNKPFEYVKKEMVYVSPLQAGTAPPSLVQRLLSDPPENITNMEERIKGTARSMYVAGADTVYSAMLTFILAMALNWNKQHLAQVEVDRVVGTDRLPMIEDMPNLPYELFGWFLTPGLAYRSSKDNVYEGYFIPKSTIVIPMCGQWIPTCADVPTPG